MRQNVGKPGGGRRHFFQIVFAEKRCHRGCDLGLRYRGNIGALSQCRSIGPEDCDPDVLRSLLVNAMLLPIDRTASPTVVSGDDESGLVAVSRRGLHRVPEFLSEALELMGAL